MQSKMDDGHFFQTGCDELTMSAHSSRSLGETVEHAQLNTCELKGCGRSPQPESSGSDQK